MPDSRVAFSASLTAVAAHENSPVFTGNRGRGVIGHLSELLCGGNAPHLGRLRPRSPFLDLVVDLLCSIDYFLVKKCSLGADVCSALPGPRAVRPNRTAFDNRL